MTESETAAGMVPLHPINAVAQPAWTDWYCRINWALILGILLTFLLARTATVSNGGVDLFGHRLPEMCLSKLVLGRPCVGCGLTRSFVLAVAGQWSQSCTLHPSGIWLAGLLFLQMAGRTLLLAIRPKRPIVWQVELAVSLAALFAVLYIPPIVLSR